MSLVEKEITQKNVELARNRSEFPIETEGKYAPRRIGNLPERLLELDKNNEHTECIDQLYLSDSHDEFSLRLRETTTTTGTEYTATVKSPGEIVDGGLRRIEISTPISAETYDYYKAMDLPSVTKVRTKLMEGVDIDVIYGAGKKSVIVEIEDESPTHRAELLELAETITGPLVDHTHDPAYTNEAIAHALDRYNHPDRIRQKPESLTEITKRALHAMVALYVSGMGQVVVSFDGLPGAGKTTVTNGLEQSLVELYGEAMRPITLSTDDYHVGKTGLEARHGAPYTEWDTAKTYDIEQLKLDIAQLEMNLPIMKRHFDFDSEEPVFDGEISSTSPFVIIEGIHAGSSNLNGVRHLHFEMPTGIATSVGRDLRRLVIENRANRVFPTPESRLRYQIETVVPAYFERERPSKKAFSACERPLAERAFMLNALTE